MHYFVLAQLANSSIRVNGTVGDWASSKFKCCHLKWVEVGDWGWLIPPPAKVCCLNIDQQHKQDFFIIQVNLDQGLSRYLEIGCPNRGFIDFCVSKVWYKIHTTNKIDPIPLQILLF